MNNNAAGRANNSLFRQAGATFGCVFVAGVCLLISFAQCPIDEKLILAAWILAMGGISVWLFSRTAGNPTLNRLATLAAVGLTFAFPFKAVLSQCELGRDQVEHFFLPPSIFSDSLFSAVAYTLGAILALSVAVVHWQSCRIAHEKVEKQLNFPFMFLTISIALLIKYVAQYILIWGVPNVPSQNNVFLLTGAVAMFVKLGIFHLIIVAITAAIVSRTSKANWFVLGILSLCYLGLDFGIGSKYSLIYVMVAGVFSVAISTNRIRFSFKKLTMVTLIALTAISLYPIIHNYRFAKRRYGGRSTQKIVTEAVHMAMTRTDQNIVFGSLLGVAKRVNGFQNHAAAIIHRNALGVTWRDMISSSGATRNYTIAVTGIEHESNAFGITQSGMMAAQFENSPLKILLGSFLMNLSLYICAGWLLWRACDNVANWYAVGVSGGLFLVYFQFQGGNLAVVAKQLIVIGTTAYFCNYMFKKKRKSVGRKRAQAIQAPQQTGSHA
jgi:hypothetical protein